MHSSMHRSMRRCFGLVSIAACFSVPCFGQSSGTAAGLTRTGTISARITEVPFLDGRYTLNVTQQVEQRFRHSAPSSDLQASLHFVINRDGTVGDVQLVSSSGNADFDAQARAALDRAASEKALGALPASFTAAALPIVLTFSSRPMVDLSGTSSDRARSGSAGQVFFEFQVDKPVKVAPGSAAPRFPDMLRAAGVSGEVLAQFVVDTLGLIDTTTVQVLRSSHAIFTRAVTNAMPMMRFTPAEVGRRKVKQLVQQPFSFSIAPAVKDTAVKKPLGLSGVEKRPNANTVPRSHSADR